MIAILAAKTNSQKNTIRYPCLNGGRINLLKKIIKKKEGTRYLCPRVGSR
jgi:predicted RNA-binding Zn-ribbon protein involved in translation (DUF1610 family)